MFIQTNQPVVTSFYKGTYFCRISDESALIHNFLRNGRVRGFISIKIISEEHKKLESSFHVHKNEAITKLENALWELKSIYTMYKQMNKTLSNDHMKSFLLQKTKSQE